MLAPLGHPSISQLASSPVSSRTRRTARLGFRMTVRPPSDWNWPALTIRRAVPQSMKPAPARSRMSRRGLVRRTADSCSARTGLVVRFRSPLYTILAVSCLTSTAITTCIPGGPAEPLAGGSGRAGGSEEDESHVMRTPLNGSGQGSSRLLSGGLFLRRSRKTRSQYRLGGGPRASRRHHDLLQYASFARAAEPNDRSAGADSPRTTGPPGAA